MAGLKISTPRASHRRRDTRRTSRCLLALVAARLVVSCRLASGACRLVFLRASRRGLQVMLGGEEKEQGRTKKNEEQAIIVKLRAVG
jgi:hypothetical protein